MTTIADVRRLLDAAVVELPINELAELVGILATVDARARARMVTPAATTEMPTMVTAQQVAARLSVPASQVYEQARQGRIPCVRVGKNVRFDLNEVLRALADTKTAALGTRKTRSNGAGFSAAATGLLPRGSAKTAPEARRG